IASGAWGKRQAGSALQKRRTLDRINDDVVEKIPARTIFDFYDPQVGIKTNFSRKARLNFGLRFWYFSADNSDEHAVSRSRLIEYGLRSRPIEGRGAVKPVDLDKYRAGFLGAALTDRSKHPFDRATAKICCNPYNGLQPHQLT